MQVIDIHKSEGRFFFFIKNFPLLFEDLELHSIFSNLPDTLLYEETKSVLVPSPEGQEPETLNQIKQILEFKNVEFVLSDATLEEVQKYENELNQFNKFSKNAYLIRNDEFRSNSSLMKSFNEFKRILDSTLVRGLYPLQELSSFHMAFTKNSLNFSVPGAGKTSIVYGAYTYLKSLPKEDPNHVDCLLVIGPLASFRPWEVEYAECFGKEVNSFRVSGSNKKAIITREEKQAYFYKEKPAEITLMFHGAVNDYKNEVIHFLKKNKCMVVVDEAHKIKRPDKVWGKSVADISREAIARVALTGTPVPNGYEDIYNLFKFIYPFKFREILGMSYTSLKSLSQIDNPENPRVLWLKDRLSPFFIRIKKSDLKLPPQIHKNIIIKMSNSQRLVYDFLLEAFLENFQSSSSASIKDILNRARLIRLRQAASDPSMLLRPIKEGYDEYYNEFESIDDKVVEEDILELIEQFSSEVPNKYIQTKEIVEEVVEKNEKIIIWTIFIHNAKRLQEYLQKNKVQSKLLIGEIDIDERESTIKKFNNPQDASFHVVIANPFSVSESISLHKGCTNALYLERDYNCSNFLQSMDRIHRYGQTKSPTYYYLISYDSIDEIIDDRLNKKIERMNELINDDIPLFANIDNGDETEIVSDLLNKASK
jgi:SNF2 family DNA or RNA helicase